MEKHIFCENDAFYGFEIKPSELFHIFINQPISAGDTLSGGAVVSALVHHGLVLEDTDGRYIVTKRGLDVLHSIIEAAEQNGVFIKTVITINFEQ